MQSWQQPPPTLHHHDNPSLSFPNRHAQTTSIAQTEPWTFGARSGLAHRQAHHVPLPEIAMGSEQTQPIFIPAHKGKARSMAMSITELIVPDQASSPRPVTAPASLNSVNRQATYAVDVNTVAPIVDRMDERQDHVFHSASCQHQIPCLMGGLENVATQYKGVPSDGWRALDKLADMSMVSRRNDNNAGDHELTCFFHFAGPGRTDRRTHRPFLHHIPRALASARLFPRAPLCAPLFPLVGDVPRQPAQGRRVLLDDHRSAGDAGQIVRPSMERRADEESAAGYQQRR